MPTIHDECREEVKLAFTYAEDGAFYRAADIFRGVSTRYEARADSFTQPGRGSKRGTYTREQFLGRMRAMLLEMEQDHEDCTGIKAGEMFTLEGWLGELQSLEDNS